MNRSEPWFDDLAEGVVLVDQARVIALNRAAAELLKVDLQTVPGQPLIAVLRDHRLEHAYIEGRPIEVATRGRLVLATPIRGGLSLRDVTEVKTSQEGARELLAVLSHELRTPTTSIRAALETLRLELDGEMRDRFLGRAVEECTRLTRLIEDLTVDVTPPKVRRVVLSEILGRAQSVLLQTLDEHGVRLAAEVPNLTVWADADKLLQVIINLVENAAIHGPDFATVEVAAAVDPNAPDFVRVTVRDRGRRLEPGHLETLFELHSRGPSPKVRGTGLGLYIVRSITSAWGGRAWAEPVEGGNTFAFTVPREAATDPGNLRREQVLRAGD